MDLRAYESGFKVEHRALHELALFILNPVSRKSQPIKLVFDKFTARSRFSQWRSGTAL
jgi:hypothetical protein